MADSFNKKERAKKKRKRKKEKAERREHRKQQDGLNPPEFMYVDENGHLTPTPPDPAKKRKVKAEDIDVSVPKQDKTAEPEGVRTGIVKFFNQEKGYGFIACQATREEFFVHADSLMDEIRDNDQVNFEVAPGPKGPVAINVSRV